MPLVHSSVNCYREEPIVEGLCGLAVNIRRSNVCIMACLAPAERSVESTDVRGLWGDAQLGIGASELGNGIVEVVALVFEAVRVVDQCSRHIVTHGVVVAERSVCC